MNDLEIEVKPSAQLDIADAAVYYELKNQALRTAFLNEITSAFSWISRFPEAAPLAHEPFRMRLTKRFPYRILYRLDDPKKAVVYAVLHQSRDYIRIVDHR